MLPVVSQVGSFAGAHEGPTAELLRLIVRIVHVRLADPEAGLGIGVMQSAQAKRNRDVVGVPTDQIGFKLDVWLSVHEDQRNQPAIRAVFDGLATGLIDIIAFDRRSGRVPQIAERTYAPHRFVWNSDADAMPHIPDVVGGAIRATDRQGPEVRNWDRAPGIIRNVTSAGVGCRKR